MGAETRVKICGLRDVRAARAAVAAGADMIGVLLSPSRRMVGLEVAAEVLAEASERVVKVGVFVDPSLEEVMAAVEEAGIQAAQLCGSESPDFCRSLGVPAIKSFRIFADGARPEPREYPGPLHHVDAPNALGGAGLEWDWSLAAELAARYEVLLAGGLNPENVGRAIISVSPWGVDVSSGVETGGVKDLDKILRFIEAAKR